MFILFDVLVILKVFRSIKIDGMSASVSGCIEVDVGTYLSPLKQFLFQHMKSCINVSRQIKLHCTYHFISNVSMYV